MGVLLEESSKLGLEIVLVGGAFKVAGKLYPSAREAYLAVTKSIKLPSKVTAQLATSGAKLQKDITDIIPSGRIKHILYGDGTGGGHLWPGLPGKSSFPKEWSKDRILREINEIAQDQTIIGKTQSNGRIVKDKIIDGVNVRVVVEPAVKGGKVVTSFPTNLPINPK